MKNKIFAILTFMMIMPFAIANASTESDLQLQLNSLLGKIASLQRDNPVIVLKLFGENKRSTSTNKYENIISTRPNDIVVLEWESENLNNCYFKGTNHKAEAVAENDIEEVRAPQAGKSKYSVTCVNKTKKYTKNIILQTEKYNTHGRSIEISVRNKKETNNKYVNNSSIVLKPRSLFDFKWKIKGYNSCSLETPSMYYSKTVNIELSGESKGWTAPDAGFSSDIIIICTYQESGEIKKDYRIIDIRGEGTAPDGIG